MTILNTEITSKLVTSRYSCINTNNNTDYLNNETNENVDYKGGYSDRKNADKENVEKLKALFLRTCNIMNKYKELVKN